MSETADDQSGSLAPDAGGDAEACCQLDQEALLLRVR